MRPEKRVLDVVSSAEIVLRSEPRALYLVAGDGPQREAMVELVASKGLSESFRFLGELDHANVPAYMALCDVVVVASEREGYSLVCREAQASGCALVVSDIPAGLAAARGGDAAMVFRLGDVADLAAKTLTLARDSTRRQSLGGSARAAVLGNSGDGWIRSWSEAIVATARGQAARWASTSSR
jgi:1,2-diacylglycerol 3-alpha-glucosyltransferase